MGGDLSTNVGDCSSFCLTNNILFICLWQDQWTTNAYDWCPSPMKGFHIGCFMFQLEHGEIAWAWDVGGRKPSKHFLRHEDVLWISLPRELFSETCQCISALLLIKGSRRFLLRNYGSLPSNSSIPFFPSVFFFLFHPRCLLINLHVVGPACPPADLAPARFWSAQPFLITVPTLNVWDEVEVPKQQQWCKDVT